MTYKVHMQQLSDAYVMWVYPSDGAQATEYRFDTWDEATKKLSRIPGFGQPEIDTLKARLSKASYGINIFTDDKMSVEQDVLDALELENREKNTDFDSSGLSG